MNFITLTFIIIGIHTLKMSVQNTNHLHGTICTKLQAIASQIWVKEVVNLKIHFLSIQKEISVQASSKQCANIMFQYLKLLTKRTVKLHKI